MERFVYEISTGIKIGLLRENIIRKLSLLFNYEIDVYL